MIPVVKLGRSYSRVKGTASKRKKKGGGNEEKTKLAFRDFASGNVCPGTYSLCAHFIFVNVVKRPSGAFVDVAPVRGRASP